MPPVIIDTGSDDGAYREALMFPPWSQIAPDTFANFTHDPSGRHPNGDDLAGSVVRSFHDNGGSQ